MRAFLLTLALLVLAGPAAAEDESLPLATYTKLGIPSPSKPWTLKQHGDAATVLVEIAKREPKVLPRRGSARSGEIFDRVASADYFALLGEEAGRGKTALQRVEIGVELMGQYGYSMWAYSAANKKLRDKGDFQPELIGLTLTMLQLPKHLEPLIAAHIAILDRKKLPDNDPVRRRLARLRSSLWRIHVGALRLCTIERRGKPSPYALSDLRQVAALLTELSPALYEVQEPSTRRRFYDVLHDHLDPEENVEPDIELARSFKTLLGKLTPPPARDDK